MSSSKWNSFFKHNPLFGPISSGMVKNSAHNLPKQEETVHENQNEKVIVIQRFWRNATSANKKISINPKLAHLPEQARFIANVLTDEAIKETLLHSAKKNQLNSNQVQTILAQKNSLKCAYQLYQEGNLSKTQFFRIVDLHHKHVREEHHIEKSLNRKKIKHLRALLNNGLKNLTSEGDKDPFAELKNLLKDPDFPLVVFGLFDSIYNEGLQTQQLISLLELHQAQKKRSFVNKRGQQVELDQPYITSIFNILDDQGEFTEEAKKYLLPSLQRKGGTPMSSAFMRPVDDNETYDQLKALISQLPTSEQIFYTTVFPGKPGLTYNVLNEKAFNTVEEYGPLTQVEGTFVRFPIVIPSCGIRNAIGLLRYGVDDYMPILPQFGIKSMADMEKGLRTYRGRLAYLFYPHTPDPGNVHESAEDTYIGVFAHDQYHSDVVSSIPKYAREGLLRCVDIIRDQTDITWSNEIWIWVDADFRYFKTNQFDPHSANSVAHFCSMLDTVQLPFSNLAPYGQIIREKTGISPVGILVMIDMIKNKEDWINIGINPDLLPDASSTRVPSTFRTGRNIHKPLDYQSYYQRMKEILDHYPAISSKPAASQLLETMMIFSQETRPSQKEMVSFGNFVDELQKFGLIKIGKNNHNNIVLNFNGISIEEGKESRQLHYLSLMYKAYLQNDRPKWDKTDFIKAFQECENVLKEMNAVVQFKNKPDPKAKHILEQAIKVITQNLSLTKMEEALNTLKPLIDSYSEDDLRLFKPKTTKEKSDRILHVVLKNIYHFDGKKTDLTHLVDSLMNYIDVLKQEMNPIESKSSSATKK